ncbi:hypothetical protein C8R45DRAFT_1174082 [Mycena sanguinolenta]|nr:hypothetical protein C8R45DRAFT_1174082 [Mycena sanguinolenta]
MWIFLQRPRVSAAGRVSRRACGERKKRCASHVVGHGSTRGYPEGNPYPYPSIPYPANPRAANPYGSPAGVALPAVPQTRRVNPRYAAATRSTCCDQILKPNQVASTPRSQAQLSAEGYSRHAVSSKFEKTAAMRKNTLNSNGSGYYMVCCFDARSCQIVGNLVSDFFVDAAEILLRRGAGICARETLGGGDQSPSLTVLIGRKPAGLPARVHGMVTGWKIPTRTRTRLTHGAKPVCGPDTRVQPYVYVPTFISQSGLIVRLMSFRRRIKIGSHPPSFGGAPAPLAGGISASSTVQRRLVLVPQGNMAVRLYIYSSAKLFDDY